MAAMLAFLLLALSTVGFTSNHLKRSFPKPNLWQRHGHAPLDHFMTLGIGLKQDNLSTLIEKLYEISDPKSTHYGKHLSAAQVNELIKPPNDVITRTSSWLARYGVQEENLSFSAAKDWIYANVTVHQANQLCQTNYTIFRHVDTNSELVRAQTYDLPSELKGDIEIIVPNMSLFNSRSTPKLISNLTLVVPEQHDNGTSNRTGPVVCDTAAVTPGCLRKLYGSFGYHAQAANNSMSIANFNGEFSGGSDLREYLRIFRPDAVATAGNSIRLYQINNGTESRAPGTTDIKNTKGLEGALDAQIMLGIAWPTQMISYSTGGSQPGFMPDKFTPANTNEPFLAWIQYVLTLSDNELPSVVSISYGDDEQTVSKEYAHRVCNSFAQLGARGVSIFVSSGDEGVGATGHCFANKAPYQSKFIPEFPSSCPYVTSVGATYQFYPEVAATLDAEFNFTSGGGFSEFFPAPEYQTDAVSRYLKRNQNFPQYLGLFNPSGRAYPDVAAQGVNVTIIYGGMEKRIGGTSASAPIMGAVFALVNDALRAHGAPPMGFLNPWLYQRGHQNFTDIISGSSAGCGTEGFPATEGWDPVTGFGTPSFPKIVESFGIMLRTEDT